MSNKAEWVKYTDYYLFRYLGDSLGLCLIIIFSYEVWLYFTRDLVRYSNYIV